MKIFAWNVNGLRAVIKKGELINFLSKYSPDVLMMGETKVSEDQIESEEIRKKFPNYEQFYSFADRKGYSGTAIWVKANLQKSFSEDLELNGKFEPASLSHDPLNEGRITTLELPDFYLIAVYVPNSKDDLSRLQVRQNWDKKFTDYTHGLEQKKPVIIGGDMNVAHMPIDLARPKENEGKHGYTTEERADFDTLLKECELTDTFRTLHPDTVKYSWWSYWSRAREKNIGWRIDYLLVSRSLAPKVTSSAIHNEILGSDHCPISIEIE